MSDKPYPAGAAKVTDIILEMESLRQESKELRPKYDRYLEIKTVYSGKDKELRDLLDSMDCDSPGNFGWSGRFSWLINAVVVRALARNKECTCDDSTVVCEKCGKGKDT